MTDKKLWAIRDVAPWFCGCEDADAAAEALKEILAAAGSRAMISQLEERSGTGMLMLTLSLLDGVHVTEHAHTKYIRGSELTETGRLLLEALSIEE